MIQFSEHTFMVESIDELPALKGAGDLFIDFETTSKNPKLKSINPHHNCWIAGTAITVDDDPNAYYVPTSHNNARYNLPAEPVFDWLNDIIAGGKRWINSNTKYDAHVARNCAGIHLEPDMQLIDTIPMARLIDSDRFKYGLESLCFDWLQLDISKYSKSLKPYKEESQDYGDIPADILGEYGCHDALSVRLLWKYIRTHIPVQSQKLAAQEIKVTRKLFNLECVGLTVDPAELKLKEFETKVHLIQMRNKIKETVGRDIEPNNNDDCFDVLCNQFGLPVIEWTKPTDKNPNGNPSFGKSALKKYRAFADAPVGLIEDFLEYRTHFQLNNLFLEPYQNLQVGGLLHAAYTQAVRSGRMACAAPNMQQLSKLAKVLIHPRDGYYFLSMDYSQIEFRLIIHYINDTKCISDYNDDPFTDFHDWVKNMVGIHRTPAKTLNFMLAFGGGKKRTVNLLANDKELARDIKEQVASLPESYRQEAYKQRAEKRGEQVYNTYHDTLPGIKRLSKKTMEKAQSKGFVFNMYGRRRHIPYDRCYKAFNSIVQGSAADLFKERTLALDDLLPSDIKSVAYVHDEVLLEVPNHYDSEQLAAECLGVLENPNLDLRVPLRCSAGVSDVNWYAAAEDETHNRVVRVRENRKILG